MEVKILREKREIIVKNQENLKPKMAIFREIPDSLFGISSSGLQRKQAEWYGVLKMEKSAWLKALRTFTNSCGLLNGAEGETRTPTSLRKPGPEPGASTNSTTSATGNLVNDFAMLGKPPADEN